mmetsp:Transcript_5969/g.16870  ORF Transcript_5969/g.16870 Transcript_5969/m.16870 type:complete len:243 (-) Transcript_5969:29-757(-)|eukprot:CAMPEP_0119131054 /NCGR_PEP_ID=MMETSP1310-20130426/9329_1 /TAXON_ID=464262 /ORGANISM="Genus nov. species nov., Strain RCC2339" /LENGTH=242 /DNA_ID=CAMNT_0007121607 /DNA_START=151 /DNA_END=879 /DNA_ORIENTATION=+
MCNFIRTIFQGILAVANLLFLVLGAVVVGAGTYYYLELRDDFDSSFLGYLSYLYIGIIAIGGVTILVSLFGLVGSCTRSKICLGSYMACLVVVIIVLALVCVAIGLYYDDTNEHLEDRWLDSCEDGDTEALNKIGTEFNCCGWGSEATFDCDITLACITNLTANYTDVVVDTTAVTLTDLNISLSNFTTTCGDAVTDDVQDILLGTAIWALAVIIFEVILLIMSVCVCMKDSGKQDDYEIVE